MAHFERRDQTSHTTFHITDSLGQTVDLSPKETEELLIWLGMQRDYIFRRARNIPTYQESQQRRLCPYCGSQGTRQHDPVLDQDRDLEAYRCSNEHTFFVERHLLQIR